MRKLVFVPLSLALLVACQPGPDDPTGPANVAALSNAGMNGKVVASVTGDGHWFTPDGFFRRLTFTVRKHEGGNVAGEWQLVAGATILHGALTCMTVLDDGQRARVGGLVEQAKFSLFLPNTDVGWEVVDLGEGASGSPDQVSDIRPFRNSPPGTAARFCETGETPNPATLDEISLGNLQIHTN